MPPCSRPRMAETVAQVLEAVRGIVLDFDGVVVESAAIKTRAFRELFAGYRDHLEQIVAFHEANAGVSRYEQFKVIYQDLLHESCDEAQLRRIGERFQEMVMGAVIRCAFVNGAERFLQTFARRYDLFLVSGTPEQELRQIVDQRHLQGYFRGLYGSPRPKTRILEEILSAQRWQPHQVVVVGDSRTDYRAAADVGTAFIGRVPPEGANPFAELAGVQTVADLDELARRWNV